MQKIRTRFAPSPTGRMHVGNLRTALYEFLIARHEGGDFILRIEDTDRERYFEGALDIIYRTLEKTGLTHDEGPDKDGGCGPYVQSERMAAGIYMAYAKKLIERGEEIPAPGHQTERRGAAEPTETEPGYTGDLVCTVCGEVIEQGEEIPPTGGGGPVIVAQGVCGEHVAWTLNDDTLTVSSYLCQQATATWRGVEWRVWYTEEIPSSAGPWRLRGLPGMIVEAKSEAHTFRLAEVRQEASPITAPDQSPDVHRMEYAKLLKHKNAIYGNRQYAKNPTYYVPDLNGSIKDMSILHHNGQQLVLANGGHPLLMKAHVYQPLEQ